MKQSIFIVLLLSCNMAYAQKINSRSAASITADRIEQKVIEWRRAITETSGVIAGDEINFTQKYN